MSWVKYGLVAFVGCSFIGMILYALLMRDQIRQAQLEPPLISASDVPVKRRPEEPGGMDIPNRDKLVFDLLSNSTSNVLPGVSTISDSLDMPTDEPVSVTKSQLITPTSILNEIIKSPTVVVVSASQKPLMEEQVVEPVIPVKPVQKVNKDSDLLNKSTTTLSKSGWGIQVGVVSNQSDAGGLVNKVKTAFPSAQKLVMHISSVKVDENTKFRVQLIGLENRDAAVGLCKVLSPKQPCFPVKAN